MVELERKALEVDQESSDANPGSPLPEGSNDSGSRRSSSIPDELSPTSIRDQLRYCLADVRYVGSFTASQAQQRTVDPGLQVNGVGNISLPLSLADAKAIMKAGGQAPFGRRSKTVVDSAFRNTTELNPSQFTLRNPAWEQELQDIIAHLGQTLGFQERTSNIKPELYKLLLYEKGAMFKAHKDSEKTEGMFGTLVICLPSKHSGGSVVLSHHGETIVFETAAASEFGQSHIAWYSDVIHEIKPVNSGYRLVLTYNLIRTGYQEPPSASVLVAEKKRLQGILSDWKQRFNAGQPTLSKLAWILDHKYSEANLGLKKLKGHDDLLGRYMAEICEKEGFTIMFANMTLTVYEAARELYDDDELEQTLSLSKVLGANGHLTLCDAAIKEDELIQEDCFDRDPDKVEAEETGNEGVDETHFYHDALLLVMPRAFVVEFTLEHRDSNDVMRWIKRLIGHLEDDPDQEIRNVLIQICRWEAKTSYEGRGEGFIALDELTRYDSNLHLNFIAINNVRSRYEDLKVENTTLSEMSKFKSWEKARIKDIIRRADQLVVADAPQLVDVLKRHGKDMANKHVLPLLKKHKSCTAAVISCLVDIFEAGRSNEIPQDTAKSIFGKAVHTTTSALSLKLEYPKKTQKEPDTSKFRGYGHNEWRSETELVERVVSFYCQCLFIDHGTEAAGILSWLKDEVHMANIDVFHEFILPFLAKLYRGMQQYDLLVSGTQQEACQYMVLAFLNRCVGAEPAKPITWTRSTRGCGEEACLICPEMDDFLKDPEKEIAYLEDAPPSYSRDHLHTQASGRFPHDWGMFKHECTPNHEMEDGRKMLKIQKSDQEWTVAHEAWKSRCADVAGALQQGLVTSRPLLGDRYEELVEMRPIKIST